MNGPMGVSEAMNDARRGSRSEAMTTAVKRACDACHRRKVKCDGVNPCRNCSASQLSCTYNAIPQKKGPKGSRAKVISELRETQRQTSLSAKVSSRISGVCHSPPSPILAPTPGLMTPDTVKDCVDFFFANMYSTMPILQRQALEQQMLYMDTRLDTYCLLTSLCAFVMLQPGMSIPGGDPYGLDSMPGANIVSATLLMEETCRVRRAYDYLDSPTFNSLCTSYFLFCCYYGLEMHEKAWYHLREATTLVHMIGMNKEDTYMQYDCVESSRRRRLFWLLFITERAYALQRHRPLTLQATINGPAINDDPNDAMAHQLTKLLSLVTLFRNFDDAFVGVWNKTRGECSQTYIQTLQTQLQESLPACMNDQQGQLNEMQHNQEWLKNISWRLGVANGHSGENDMSYRYHPVDMARDLMPMVTHFPGNMGLLGLGMAEKLYGITFLLNDYLSMQQGPRSPFTIGPRQHLHQLLNVLTMLRNGDYRFLPLLLCKVTDVLPKMINPMLQNAPDNTNLCNIDIFDGFGNAGMAQTSSFATDDYDNKYMVSRAEDLSNDSGSSSSSSGPSPNDMSPPFTSSPAIMSPSVDLLPTYNNMADMIGPIPRSTGNALNNALQMNGQQAQRSQLAAYEMQNMGPNMPNMGQASGLSICTQNVGMNQGINSAMSPMTMVGNTMMTRAPSQAHRCNSFAVSQAPLGRAVGDFHAVQRANTDLSSMTGISMSSMGSEMDFNTTPR